MCPAVPPDSGHVLKVVFGVGGGGEVVPVISEDIEVSHDLPFVDHVW